MILTLKIWWDIAHSLRSAPPWSCWQLWWESHHKEKSLPELHVWYPKKVVVSSTTATLNRLPQRQSTLTGIFVYIRDTSRLNYCHNPFESDPKRDVKPSARWESVLSSMVESISLFSSSPRLVHLCTATRCKMDNRLRPETLCAAAAESLWELPHDGRNWKWIIPLLATRAYSWGEPVVENSVYFDTPWHTCVFDFVDERYTHAPWPLWKGEKLSWILCK